MGLHAIEVAPRIDTAANFEGQTSAVAYPGAHLDKHKAEIRSFDAFTDTPLLNRDMAVRYFSTSSPVPLYPGSR